MLIGMDKFDGEYVKIIGDFNKVMTSIQFEYARIQKIDNDFCWLLCYTPYVPNVEFRYKPTQNRFPAKCAILLKRKEYSINVKDKQWNWQKLTFKPALIELWLIEHFECYPEYFLSDNFFTGNLVISETNHKAMPVVPPTVPLNSQGFLMTTQLTEKFELPDCELKQPGNQSKTNNKAYSTPKEKIYAGMAWYTYLEACNIAESALETLAANHPDKVEKHDLHILRLVIFADLLNNR